MRKLFLSVFVLLLAVSAVTAQTGADALKAAKKSFDAYNLSKDQSQLVEAGNLIEKAMQDATVAADSKALLEAGDIYSAIFNTYLQSRVLDPTTAEVVVPGAAVKAAESYVKAYEKADKKPAQKAALNGLQGVQGNISNEGIYAIQDKNYTGSAKAFQTSVMVDKFLRDNGGESALDETKLQDEKYYAGLSLVLNEEFDTAEPFFTELYAGGYNDAGLYDALYKIAMAKEDKASAAKYLTEGRTKFPEETSLLFTEINYYLSEGRLDELTNKLQEAINKEPENLSLYATLGQVYENLYKQESEAGNTDKANEYFGLAQTQYQKGLEIDPNAAKLIYSLGAMIYNRGAAMTQELIELGNDFSKEGQKKYEMMKTQVDAEFEKALPYFQKAEMADPNDLNTLIALKEMYARVDEYEISGEFKTRIEKIQGGETITKSYFKEKGM